MKWFGETIPYVCLRVVYEARSLKYLDNITLSKVCSQISTFKLLKVIEYHSLSRGKGRTVSDDIKLNLLVTQVTYGNLW